MHELNKIENQTYKVKHKYTKVKDSIWRFEFIISKK